jgi:hypothetical protein
MLTLDAANEPAAPATRQVSLTILLEPISCRRRFTCSSPSPLVPLQITAVLFAAQEALGFPNDPVICDSAS